MDNFYANKFNIEKLTKESDKNFVLVEEDTDVEFNKFNIEKLAKESDKNFVLVEGDTDVELFERFFNPDKVQLCPLRGKDEVEKAISYLTKPKREDTKDRVIGICDADFDHIDLKHFGDFSEIDRKKKKKSHPKVFLTDTHDIETMIIDSFDSSALSLIISKYSTKQYHKRLSEKLPQQVLEICRNIGLMRWISHRKDLGIKFNQANYEKFLKITRKGFGFDIRIENDEMLVTTFLENSALKKNVRPGDILDEMETYKDKDADRLHVCCGHDITQTITMVLKRARKKINVDEKLDRKDIESALRTAYSLEAFKKTSLFERINKWKENLFRDTESGTLPKDKNRVESDHTE